MKRELEQLLNEARALGATVTKTRSGHYRVLVPGGGIVICPRTPSDWRSVLNTRADLRKAGLAL
jgi:hypothetical protein